MASQALACLPEAKIIPGGHAVLGRFRLDFFLPQIAS